MKKITLLFISLIVSLVAHSQETTDLETLAISFETSEGYTLGNINGQNGWSSSGDGQGGFIENQVVSDEESSDGNLSLKITQETAYGTQPNFSVGGFHELTNFIDTNNVVISFDLFISQPGSASNGSRYRFGLSGTGLDNDGNPILVFPHFFDFGPTGEIFGIDTDALEFTPIGTYSFGQWFNIRLENMGNTLEYYLDDTLLFTDQFLNPSIENIEGFRFVHNNDGEVSAPAYIDNIRFNDETLSINNFETEDNFVHFTQNNSLQIQSTTSLNDIEVFNIEGKRIIQYKLDGANDAQINIDILKSGVYIAKLNTANEIHTFKFAK